MARGFRKNPCDCSSIRSHVNTPPLHCHWSKTEGRKKNGRQKHSFASAAVAFGISRDFSTPHSHILSRGWLGSEKVTAHRWIVVRRRVLIHWICCCWFLFIYRAHAIVVPVLLLFASEQTKSLRARCKRKKSSRSEGKTPHQNLSLPLSSLLAAAAFFRFL